MENQNQSYDTHESMYIAKENEENEQQPYLHGEETETPEVLGDPSETAEDHELDPAKAAAGYADTDSLLKDTEGPGDPDEEDDDLEGDDFEDDDPDDDDDLDSDPLVDPDAAGLDDDDFEDDDDFDDDGILNKETDKEETFLK